MLRSHPLDIFLALSRAEEVRAIKFARDILEGADSADVQVLKRQWRTDAVNRSLRLSEHHQTLRTASKFMDDSSDMSESIRTAMDMQWLLSRVTEHLIKDGLVPPAVLAPDGVNYITAPSFDHALQVLHSSDPDPDAVAKRKKLRSLFASYDMWYTLRDAEEDARLMLDWSGPPRENGRMKVTCLDGFYNASAMETAIQIIKFENVDIVPCSIRPATVRAISTDDLTSAASDAAEAGRKVDKIQDEIIALVTKNPANSKPIEEKKQQLADATAKQDALCARVMELCMSFIADAKKYTHPLRPYLDAQWLLSGAAERLSSYGLVPYHWDQDYGKSPIFDYALQALNSTDPDPAAIEKRKKLRASFTEDEWEYFTVVSTKCFNALYNAEPPRVDGFLEIFCYDNIFDTETLTEIARFLNLDFHAVSTCTIDNGSYRHLFIHGTKAPLAD